MNGINQIKYKSQRDIKWANTPINGTTITVGRMGLHFPTFSFRWREGMLFSTKNEDIDIEMVKAYLTEGDKHADRAVIIQVANQSHWVVGLWSEQDGDILCIDPWTGKTCDVLHTYKNITGAGFFVRSTQNEWKGKGKPEAPLYN